MKKKKTKALDNKTLAEIKKMREKEKEINTRIKVAETLGGLSKNKSFMFAYCDGEDSVNISWCGKPAEVIYLCEQIKTAVIERQNSPKSLADKVGK